MKKNILQISNLKTYYHTLRGTIKAVDDVSFDVKEDETLGIVGESGCGKSTVAHSITRLIPNPPGKIVGGNILFNGEDLLKKSEKEMRNIRGNNIAMCFQDPLTYLNPVMRVGDQITEVILTHQKLTKGEAIENAIKILSTVGIPSPLKIIQSYPHQLSGGMRQRVVLTIALACKPDLLIADEPTTALDTIIQAQIIDLLHNIREKLNISIMLISHDFGLISELCDTVCVMYAGKLLEKASIKTILKNPFHPYTKGLLDAIPTIDGKKGKLEGIKGVVPDPINPPLGCRFHPRCSYAIDVCKRKEPNIMEVNEGHFLACWRTKVIISGEINGR